MGIDAGGQNKNGGALVIYCNINPVQSICGRMVWNLSVEHPEKASNVVMTFFGHLDVTKLC